MILGLGSGTRTMNERWYSIKFDDPPAPRMREAVQLVRAAIAAQKGGGLKFAGRYYQIDIPQYSRARRAARRDPDLRRRREPRHDPRGGRGRRRPGRPSDLHPQVHPREGAARAGRLEVRARVLRGLLGLRRRRPGAPRGARADRLLLHDQAVPLGARRARLARDRRGDRRGVPEGRLRGDDQGRARRAGRRDRDRRQARRRARPAETVGRADRAAPALPGHRRSFAGPGPREPRGHRRYLWRELSRGARRP